MRFDTKIVVVVRDDLETWQRLNVTAFLASGIAANPDLLGEPYADADGTRYLPLFRQPVLVMEGDKNVVAAARERAVRRGVPTAVFTSDMFSTGHDDGEPGRRRGRPRRRPRPGGRGGPRAPQRRRQDRQGRGAAPVKVSGTHAHDAARAKALAGGVGESQGRASVAKPGSGCVPVSTAVMKWSSSAR